MRQGIRSCLALAALAAGACATPSFDIGASFSPQPKAEQVTLTGYFDLNGLQFRLYPGATGDEAPCISGALTSLAGVPTPEFTTRQMAFTGHLHRTTDAEAENIPNPCGGALVMLANDVAVP
jgi:hypothetical protein